MIVGLFIDEPKRGLFGQGLSPLLNLLLLLGLSGYESTKKVLREVVILWLLLRLMGQVSHNILESGCKLAEVLPLDRQLVE